MAEDSTTQILTLVITYRVAWVLMIVSCAEGQNSQVAEKPDHTRSVY